MSYKKSDVKDGRPPCRAKPLKTRIKVQGYPKPARENPIAPPPPKTNMGRVVKIVRLKDLPASERRVQVVAARLRVTLDERLDRSTPPEVQALAKEPL